MAYVAIFFPYTKYTQVVQSVKLNIKKKKIHLYQQKSFACFSTEQSVMFTDIICAYFTKFAE